MAKKMRAETIGETILRIHEYNNSLNECVIHTSPNAWTAKYVVPLSILLKNKCPNKSGRTGTSIC